MFEEGNQINETGFRNIAENLGTMARLRRNIERSHYAGRTEVLKFFLPNPGFLNVGQADQISNDYFLGFFHVNDGGRIFEKKDMYRQMTEEEIDWWSNIVRKGNCWIKNSLICTACLA